MRLQAVFAVIRIARPGLAVLERFASPLIDLFIRALLFRIFFFAGTAKLGNWSGTLELFEYEYQVPFLPPMLAAYMGAAAELGCSILLLLGLASRLATVKSHINPAKFGASGIRPTL